MFARNFNMLHHGIAKKPPSGLYYFNTVDGWALARNHKNWSFNNNMEYLMI